MIKRVLTPHLPNGDVKHIIIGKKYRKLLENAAIENDLSVFWLEDNVYSDERLSGHCDLSAVHTGNDRVYFAEYLSDCEIVDKITKLGFKVNYTANIAKAYPKDAKLNFCIVGDKVILNPETADSSIVSELDAKHIHVRQGYTKCSVCVTDDNSIITTDKMISAKAEASGMNVLYIDKPFVRLDGFDYGFIGGATFKLSKNKMAFTGIIKDASIRNEIEAFLSIRGIEPVYLTQNEIFDIGSAIPLTEQVYG